MTRPQTFQSASAAGENPEVAGVAPVEGFLSYGTQASKRSKGENEPISLQERRYAALNDDRPYFERREFARELGHARLP